MFGGGAEGGEREQKREKQKQMEERFLEKPPNVEVDKRSRGESRVWETEKSPGLLKRATSCPWALGV